MKYTEKYSKYFWDVNVKSLDPKQHKNWIISRILEEGGDEAVSDLFDNYNKREIEYVVENSRALSDKTKNFWKLKLSDNNV